MFINIAIGIAVVALAILIVSILWLVICRKEFTKGLFSSFVLWIKVMLSFLVLAVIAQLYDLSMPGETLYASYIITLCLLLAALASVGAVMIGKKMAEVYGFAKKPALREKKQRRK